MLKTALFIVAGIIVIGGIFTASSYLNQQNERERTPRLQSNTSSNTTQSTETPSSTNTSETSQSTTTSTANRTSSELSTKNTDEECWVAYDKKVYNVTAYLERHPGGKDDLLRQCGKQIDSLTANHPGGEFGSKKIQDLLKPFYIGDLIN